VTLTFDVDGAERWRARARQGDDQFDNPTIRSMGRYGPDVAVPRILDLLDRYDLPGCFFVPGIVAEERPEMVRRIHDAGHEIGHHGYTHTNPSTMTAAEERREFERANEVFEDILGESPVGYRTPAADTAERTLRLLVESDLTYDSTLMGNDVPYFLEYDGRRIVELPFHWSTDDAAYFTFNMFPTISHQSGIDSQADVYDNWRAEFDACYERGLLFTLVTHPQIIGRPQRIHMYERLLQYITGHADVWVARPRDIARHWNETQHAPDAMTLSLN
jgi:peptidoglycan/xylan/chitin deacetylase (PgdA/CDA1 family)